MKTLFIQLCFLSLLLTAASDDWTSKLSVVKDGVEQIKNFMNGANKGKSYVRLAFATDTYGPRLAGSDGLERAIDLLKRDSANNSLDVKEEKVMVTSWQEVSSSATFHSKIRNKSLAIVAYGPSVPGKLTAPVLLVKSFDELAKKASEAVGKIVVYNQECQDYPTCVQYRNDGASRAAEHGAVASLTRSIASFSIYNPHTGSVMYKDKKIPAAAITIEDAAFIERIMKRDPSATIDLHINTVTGEERESRNLIIDIPGTNLKNEILLAGTHTDSWHVDDGVSNNAIGCNMLYEAMRAIKKLGLKPRRTLRLALWTAGEQDSKGERQYFAEQEKNKEDKIKLIMRSERGVYNISGLIINNGEKLHAPVRAIFDTFFKEWNLNEVSNLTASASTSKWVDEAKIPRFEFLTNMRRYFAVYNSGGDTLDKLTSEEVDRAVTLWATILYTLGTIDVDFS